MALTLHGPPASSAPSAVLDTNVVLDWLVFRNTGCQPLAQAIEAGRLQWLTTEPMRDELAHVLGRGVVRHWQPDEDLLWSTWHRLSSAPLTPTPQGPMARLRCTDPDDQKFIDAAIVSAQWLISRDRAVLKLARRAAALGLRIVTPERWADLNQA